MNIFSGTVSNGSTQLWSMAILSTNILQGSVATHLMGGVVFYYRFATNLLPSLSVKGFLKSKNRSAFDKVRSKTRRLYCVE